MLRTRILPALMLLIGVALIVRTASLGGGVVGYLFGVLFIAAGGGRLWLETHPR
jgi:hypothetical protein